MISNRYGNGVAVIALALLATTGPSSALADEAASSDAAPIVLAEATTSPRSRSASPAPGALPAFEVAARAAPAEGPDALRRYIHRPRMIYALWYYDYAQ